MILPKFKLDLASGFYFPNETLVAEFHLLPAKIKATVRAIADSLTDTKIFVTSVRSSMNGQPRTAVNGPNHSKHRAVDFVPTPYDTPMFVTNSGKPRSAFFNSNLYLIKHMTQLYAKGLLPATVLLEPDHIHVDDTHKPSVLVAIQDKPVYDNARPPAHLCTEYKVTTAWDYLKAMDALPMYSQSRYY